MAEGRMIKKRISLSHKFAKLKSNNARLLYLMIYPHLDIEGRIEANPKLIKGQVVPLLPFSLPKINEYLRDMHSVGLIKLYDVNGQSYLEVTKFKVFQQLRSDKEAKSQCPDPKTGQVQELDRPTPAKVKISKVKLSKDKYKDFVLLTSEEYQKLIDTYGKPIIDSKINELNDYIGSKGRKYKSHYFTIVTWLRRDGVLPQEKKQDISETQLEKKRQAMRKESQAYFEEQPVKKLKEMLKWDKFFSYRWLIREVIQKKEQSK